MLDKEKILSWLHNDTCTCDFGDKHSCDSPDSNRWNVNERLATKINNKEFDIDPIKEYEEKWIKYLDIYDISFQECNKMIKPQICTSHIKKKIKDGDFR